jgi:dCMP deaminase
MLIVIVGTEYSGRKTLQDIVVRRFGSRIISCGQVRAEERCEHNLQFGSLFEMLNFVTCHWKDNFVTTELRDSSELDPFIKRPFCLVVHIDAPVLLRYARYKRCVAVSELASTQN